MTEWWRFDGAPTAEEWQAFLAGLGLIVTAVAAALALVQLRNYLKDREDASRPYIVIDYSFRGSILMVVEITNISGALASDVRLSVDRPFQAHMSGRADVLNGVFGEGYRIKQLAPGRSIGWTFDRAPDYWDGDFPRNYEVTADYADPRLMRRSAWWRVWEPKVVVRYRDTFDLNIEQYGEARAETDRDSELANVNSRNEKRFDKLVKAAQDTAEALEARPFQGYPIAGRRRPR